MRQSVVFISLIFLTGGLIFWQLNSNHYILDKPLYFPEPIIPADNPLNKSKVELGRRLFFDENLSINQSTSCATCHLPEKAFTDGRGRALGAMNDFHPRSSMSLANVAYAASLNWADPLTDSLERQLLVPLFGEEPVEMGMNGKEKEIIEYLSSTQPYPKLFKRSFQDKVVSIENLAKALASFQRTLISGNAPYDRYLLGDDQAMSQAALRGMQLFFSEKVECFHCHGGFNFSDSSNHTGEQLPVKPFHNNALYNIDGEGAYPDQNTGIHNITQNPEDMGLFKAPSLRNIAVTAPYMHDGSIVSLDAVIDHYAAGGRLLATGEHQGDGSQSPFKNKFIKGFELTDQERTDLLAFLESLTDSEFLTNPDFQDPWKQ